MAKRKLEGKNVVITGGGGGLGAALGREFGFAGANVALLDIDYGAAVVAADRVTSGTAALDRGRPRRTLPMTGARHVRLPWLGLGPRVRYPDLGSRDISQLRA